VCLTALLISVLVLPGCTVIDWIQTKFASQGHAVQANGVSAKDSSDVIVWMNDKPIMTVQSLEAEKNDLLVANPQLKQMMAMMPADQREQLNRNLAEGLVTTELVNEYVRVNKMDQSSAYKQEFDRIVRSVKHMLNMKFFSQDIKIVVTDAEAKDFYEKNKALVPNLLISHGGIKSKGVKFENETAAKDFAAKVKEQKNDLEKTAAAAGLTDKVKDFKLVNDQSLALEAPLREKIVAIAKCPSVHVFVIEPKEVWVVVAEAKEDAKYRPFDQIKADIKTYLEQGKRDEVMQKELEKLRQQYKVVIKEDFFKSPAADESAQESMMNNAPMPAMPTSPAHL
jgi:hypothetical protein